MSLLHATVGFLREALGLNWIAEARAIAEAARKQREEDEARANRDPHDFARWLQEPAAYRRPAPEGKQRHES